MSPAWEVVWWWERRRIVFNLAVLAAGIVSVLAVLLTGSRLLPGEDVFEPLGLLVGAAAYAFAANACFCLGWITELLWSGGDTSRTAPVRRRLFRVGVWSSIGVTRLPGVLVPAIWAIFGFQHASP